MICSESLQYSYRAIQALNALTEIKPIETTWMLSSTHKIIRAQQVVNFLKLLQDTILNQSNHQRSISKLVRTWFYPKDQGYLQAKVLTSGRYDPAWIRDPNESTGTVV